MVRKVAKPATMVMDGEIVELSDCIRADFRSSLISFFLTSSTLCMKGISQAYILISLMELMISPIMVTLLSVRVTTLRRRMAVRAAMAPMMG